MGETFEDESDLIDDQKPGEVLEREMTAGSVAGVAEEQSVWKDKPFFSSFGSLMAEQTGLWRWYLLLVVGALGAGGKQIQYFLLEISTSVSQTANWDTAGNPIQSYLFAQLINVITYVGDALKAAADYWALRFFILSLGAGLAYFLLGYSSNTVSTVRLNPTNTKDLLSNGHRTSLAHTASSILKPY